MEIIRPIAAQFGLILLSAFCGVTLVQCLSGRRSSLVDYRRIPVLVDRQSHERTRILQTAQHEAFHGWRLLIAAIPLPVAMALGGTAALVARAYALGPNTWWFHSSVAGVMSALLMVPASRMMTSYVARYLRPPNALHQAGDDAIKRGRW
jgi:hypothetical protein